MAQCTAKSKRSGERCKSSAVAGKRVCYYHGGAPGSGGKIKHGRYSLALAAHPDVLERYERHRDDPSLMETRNEIALLRAKLDHYLTSFGDSVHPEALAAIRDYAESVGRSVERRHKMLHGEQVTVTMHHFEALTSRLVSLVLEIYGDDDKYARFLAECRGLAGAAVGDETG